ncbi:hypothetical protein T12_2511 [Trichinella patagoniensis]|uniref:Uncharacterized protein n=1 Tax=Trichinella patagoniensis TaxID=990121 RepID=A0A0V0ZK40_9BILA|nr:hypothetical protein T12_2511 [Trichinella patagoniensis]
MITDQKHLDSKQSNNLGMKRKLLISAQGVFWIPDLLEDKSSIECVLPFLRTSAVLTWECVDGHHAVVRLL